MNLFNICSLSDIFGENGALPTILSGIMNCLNTMASFFTTNTLGLIILCCALIGVVWSLVSRFIS